LLLVQDFVAEGVLESQTLDFKGSCYFMSNFLKRVRLGSRRARTQRRPILDDEECTHFMANMLTPYHGYPPHFIINFDESNWYLVTANDRTVAVRGAETVCHYCEGDMKVNFFHFSQQSLWMG
jgi:hypothetical protein